MTSTPPDHVRARLAAGAIAVLGAAAFIVLYLVYVRSAAGQAVDEAGLAGARALAGSLPGWVLTALVAPRPVAVLGVAGLVALIAAVWRRSPGVVLRVLMVVAGANGSTWVLKRSLLERSDWGVGWSVNSFPSGHVTAAATALAALVLALPLARAAWSTLAGAVLVAWAGTSVLLGQWHRPADVAGAVVVVLVWLALALLVVPVHADGRPPAAHSGVGRRSAGVLAALGGVGLLSALAAVVSQLALARDLRAVDHQVSALGESTVRSAGAGGIALVVAVAALGALAMAGAVALSARLASCGLARPPRPESTGA